MALQIPGVINWTKFLLVGGIWVLMVSALAIVVAAKDYQWVPPSGILYTSNGTLKPNFNRDDQCEALDFKPGTLQGTILEPENTWSNIGYLLAGMLILVCTRRPLGYLVGIQLCILAVLSGSYHATLQGEPQILDVAGIYFILTALLFYVLQAVFVRDLSGVREWAVGAVLTAVSFGGGLFMANNRTKYYMFGSTTVTFTVVCALVVLCVYELGRQGFDWRSAPLFWRLWAPEKSPRLDYLKVWRMFSNTSQTVDWNLRSYFTFFFFIGVPGLFCRLTDGDGKLLCSPSSKIQAHSIWHTFGAATLLIGYDLFAWGGGWKRDFPVFQRKQPEPGRVNPFTLYATAIAAAIAGTGLFILSFVRSAFVDYPNTSTDPRGSNPVPTGVAIASCFLLTAVIVLILRAFKVVNDPVSG